MSNPTSFADLSPYPDAPPSYDEAMGLLPAGESTTAIGGRSHQGSTDDIITQSFANTHNYSRQSSPTRQIIPPYPLTATEIVPRDDNPHIIRPYPLGPSTGPIVVLDQPGLVGDGVEWVTKPPEEATCPNGLEYMLDLQFVYVRRERRNFLGKMRTFSVRNAYDKMIFLVIESGKVRCSAVDRFERPVFIYVEDWSFAGENWMELDNGNQVAYFEESSGCTSNTQKILDNAKKNPFVSSDETLPETTDTAITPLSLSSPNTNNVIDAQSIRNANRPTLYLDTDCCGEGNGTFTVYSRSHATIGSIEKQALGNKIKIKFPLDLAVTMKAALISMAMKLEISEERRRGDYS